MSFIFPMVYTEIREPHFNGSYRVKSKNQVQTMDERLILLKINQFTDGFNQLITLIEDSQYFDFFYYLIEHLEKHLNQKVQLQLIEMFTFQIQKLFPNYPEHFKMTMFLLLNLLKQKQIQSTQTKRALKTISQLFSQDAFNEWEKECSRYFFEIANLGLEIKDNQIREQWIEVLSKSLLQWPQQNVGLKNKIVHLMYDSDSVVQNIGKLLIYCSKIDKIKQYSIDQVILLVSYITEKSTNQAESLVVKNLRELISITSKEMPRIYYQQLSAFIHLYENENHNIRNGLTDLITNIIEYLTKEIQIQNGDELMQTNSNNLIQQLMERSLDKIGYCRAVVLQSLAQLLNTNSIPKIHLERIFVISSSRLRDTAAIVRKAALMLIKAIVKYYRFLYVKSQGREQFWSYEQINSQINTNKEDLEEIHKEFAIIEQRHQKGEIRQEEINEAMKLIKQKASEFIKIQEYLEEYKKFLDGMQTIIQQVSQLCQSKNQADVIHSIKLFAYLKKFDFHISNNGIKRMILLVWSQDKSVQLEVIKKFWKLYLREKSNVKQIVLQLIEFIKTSNLKEQISFEKIMLIIETEQAPNFKFPQKAFKIIWEFFGKEEVDQKSLLILARVFITRFPAYLSSDKIEQIENILFSYKKTQPDWLIVKELAIILSKLNRKNEKDQNNFNKQVSLLITLLIQYQNTLDMNYFTACDSIIQLIPQANSAELMFETLLQDLAFKSQKMEQEEQKKIEEMHLSHAIYIAGCVSLQLLIFIDAVHNQLKHLKNESEKSQGKEQEIDKISGGIEGQFERLHDAVNEIQDKSLIQKNLLSIFSPMVKSILRDTLDQMETEENTLRQQSPLSQVSLITMCKFMCLSESYCKENIEMLFEIMKSPLIDQVMKNNVIISIGDLLHRWPNTIQKFHKKIYSNLLDTSAAVRRVTLLVLTHLILNDMVKSKTSLQYIPNLLIDSHPQIPAMARYFLNELSKKEQRAISNAIPDIIANVQEQNEIILSQIVQYVDKNQIESIVDKLITILGLTKHQYEARNISILLTLFTLTQNCLQKLLDGWEEYREKLTDEFIYNQFIAIVKKLRKSQFPQEARPMIDEFESKIERHDKETFENRRREKVSKKKKTIQIEGGQKQQEQKIVNEKQQQKRKPKRKQDEEIMDIESDSDQQSEESLIIKKQTTQRRKRLTSQEGSD